MNKLNYIIGRRIREVYVKRISNYILCSCNAFLNQYELEGMNIQNNENIIRNILLEEYLNSEENYKYHNMQNYRFLSEVPVTYNKTSKKHKGRTDIYVLLKNDFKEHDAHYVIECKRLDGTSRLNKKFIDEGVFRFISSKYSSFYGRSTMLAFVVNKMELLELYEKIIAYQSTKYSSIQSQLNTSEKNSLLAINEFPSNNISLEYLLFDLSKIIIRRVK